MHGHLNYNRALGCYQKVLVPSNNKNMTLPTEGKDSDVHQTTAILGALVGFNDIARRHDWPQCNLSFIVYFTVSL